MDTVVLYVSVIRQFDNVSYLGFRLTPEGILPNFKIFRIQMCFACKCSVFVKDLLGELFRA